MRFALDGAVQEANAHHAGGEQSADDEPVDLDGEHGRDDTDARMTERFRDPSD